MYQYGFTSQDKYTILTSDLSNGKLGVEYMATLSYLHIFSLNLKLFKNEEIILKDRF